LRIEVCSWRLRKTCKGGCIAIAQEGYGLRLSSNGSIIAQCCRAGLVHPAASAL